MRVLYNENQKNRYLEECKYEITTLNTVKTVFSRISPVEKRNETDVCNFNVSQIIECLKIFNAKSRRYLNNICIILFDYYNWCEKEGLVNNFWGNPFDSSRIKSVLEKLVTDEMVKNKFFTKDQFIQQLNNVKDVSNRFICYAIYLGIKGENDADELRNLKKTDLDTAENIIHLFNGRSVKVDNLFIKLFNDTVKSEHYLPEGEVAPNKLGYYVYAQSNYVLRPTARKANDFDNQPCGRQILFNRLNLIKKQMENEYISMAVIYKNGVINYIKEKYAAQGISLKEAFNTLRSDVMTIDEYRNEKQEKGRRLLTKYFYEELTQEYINEFGATNLTVRLLRSEIDIYIDELSI